MQVIVLWSVFVGSLGIEAVVTGGWLRWRQLLLRQQDQEEEELVTDHQNHRNLTKVEHPPTALPLNGGKSAEQVSVAPKPEEVTAVIAALRPPLPEASVGSSRDSHNGEWEYKIVRASFDLFRDPQIFQGLCEEELQAGWTLLEKLDDRRVRFKRAIAWRTMIKEEGINFDPYRSHYGPATGWLNVVGAIAAVTSMVLPAYLGYVLVANTLTVKPLSPAVPTLNPSGAPVFEPSTPEPPLIP
ncbi:MAG TPA: hypothetical protein V6D27_16520 [Vampirovibrionales bacterium]